MTEGQEIPFSGVKLIETALQGIGAQDPRLDQRSVNAESWFADWSEQLKGSEVYVGIMWASHSPRTARLMLDDWVFEDVTAGDLGELISRIFTKRATIRTRPTFFRRSRLLTLEVSIGATRYTSSKKTDLDVEPAPWERLLLTE